MDRQLEKTRKPVIGVSADRKFFDYFAQHTVPEQYLTAVRDVADAVPLVIPALGDQGLDRMLECLDGILLTGSRSNVEPHHYGVNASPEGTLFDAERDSTTLPLIRKAIAAGIPVLAVCRGFQEMNVAFGGELYQAVNKVPGMQNHHAYQGDDMNKRFAPAHEIVLSEGGVLHELIGQPKVVVNSVHGQGVKTLAPGLRPEAAAHDGLIEAFTVEAAEAFVLAVQWHPEWKVKDNAFSAKIFDAFGSACRRYANR